MLQDNESVVSSQWDSLRSIFGQMNTVLLFHLKNHYALIFALREWVYMDVDSDDKKVLKHKRQILTARKGQRCVREYLCIYYTYIYVHVYIFIYIYKYIYIWKYICVYTYTYLQIYEYICIYIYTYLQIYEYICMYVCIFI
jgi:hypothetical protein